MILRFILVSALTLAFATGTFGQTKEKADKKKYKETNDAIFSLIYDNELSTTFGANHLLADHQVLSRLQNRFVPTKLFRKKDSKLANIGNGLFRLVKVGIIDYPITFLSSTTQREVFGTKFRLESFNTLEDQAHINLGSPFAFGAKQSNASISILDSLGAYDLNLINAAGAEANRFMADLSQKNMFLNGDFMYEEALMFLFTNNDLAIHNTLINDYGGDRMENYVDNINATYGAGSIDKAKLKILSFIDMGADPMNFAALIGIGKYIAKGEEMMDLFWIKAGERIKYLPSVKMNLAPFGPLLNYQNFIKFDHSMFELDVKHAAVSYVKSFGVDLKAFNLLFGEKKRLSIDALLSIWDQPEMSFKVKDVYETVQGFGGSGATTFNYRIFNKFNAYLQGTIGYKSKGYQEGLSLNNDLIFNIGFAYR